MERVKSNKTVTALLTSDWHLREDTPTCFTEDFQKEQWDAVDFIVQLAEKYQCPVICAGDFYHHWKTTPWLLSETIKHINYSFCSIYVCYGQHDLPQHSLELANKGGLYTLMKANKIHLLNGCHFGQMPDVNYKPLTIDGKLILVWHHLTYQQKPFPGAEGGMAAGILRKYPQFDLIVTGDNHQSFSEEYQGRLLVNPGSLTRQTADQADFKPRVALWYAETNTIEWVYLPIQEGVISREHLAVKEQRDARIDAFVSRLNDDYKTELSFEDNLENFFNVNQVRDSVKEIIYQSLE